MNESMLDPKSALQERVNILKSSGYRGFKIFQGKEKPEFSVEVCASNETGTLLIAVGNTIDEAYENLVERIDITLDG